MSDLSDAEEVEGTAVTKDEPDDDIGDGLTDWLHELDDIDNPTEAHAAENAAVLDSLLNEEPDSSDWLTELGPAQTDIFEQKSDDLEAEAADETPGWMDELGPVQTNLLDPNEIAKLTGPLEGMDDANIVNDEEAGADVSFTNLFETASEAIEPLPDWLDTAAEIAVADEAVTEDSESFLTDLPDADEPDMSSGQTAICCANVLNLIWIG